MVVDCLTLYYYIEKNGPVPDVFHSAYYCDLEILWSYQTLTLMMKTYMKQGTVL